MEIVETIKAVRKHVAQARALGKSIGFVPTMGALHAGHVSLMEAAQNRCDYVVVSIFVNPTQFAPDEDFNKYPRDISADAEICKKSGVDLIFAPKTSEMYQDKNITRVSVEELTRNLCGKTRPVFFQGVTTVCTKLFNIVAADVAFFGQKDAQQTIVIKRMVSDLRMPLEIVVCPTVRETSGLAVSSRNKYLSSEERKDAPLLYVALRECENLARGGCRNCKELIEAIQKLLNTSAIIEIEYINIVDSETLEDIDSIKHRALVAVAAKIGTTRLIDNLVLDLNK